MTSLLSSAIGRFRLISLLEGGSYLILVGIAMPLKYLAGQPLAVRIFGMAHGALFVLFAIGLLLAMISARWSIVKAAWFLFLSLIPLGFLVIEKQARPSDDDGES